MKTREQIRKAFELLRKEGVIARMNFMCCSSCALAELASLGKPVVFFNKQDNEDLKILEEVNIRYWHPDESEKSAKRLGEMVTSILTSCHINVEWDGDPSKTLYVRGLSLE
jgi:hypothetical protein